MISADVDLKAQFYDVDPMQVVWHGNYARFLELARCALLERIGYGYTEMRDSGFMWPIVEMTFKYVRPIRLAQKFRVSATLVEYENRLRIDYVCRDCGTGEVLTKARTTQVAVSIATAELRLDSPPILIEKVRRLL